MNAIIIKHACGHEAPHYLNEITKDRRIAEMLSWARKLCPDCYQAEQLKIAQVASVGLPPLTGSPAQVQWAMTLRTTIVKCVDIYIRQFEKDHEGIDTAFMHADRARMLTHTEAKWWIDNRGGLRALTASAQEREAVSK